MAGKVPFRNRERHASRFGHRATFNKDFLELLNGIFEKRITQKDWGDLVTAIAIANAENERQTKNRATRKDALAQLKAMLRLKSDDDFIYALRGCDRMTYEAVQQAQIDAISEVQCRDGMFLDTGGTEHCIPPTIDLDRLPLYFPMGVDGARSAVVAALKRIETDEVTLERDSDFALVTLRTRIHPKTGAGNIEKPYQTLLATKCLMLWRLYGNPSQRKPWCTPDTGKRSDVVGFTGEIFSAAGMDLSDSRLVALLKSARHMQAVKLAGYRRVANGLKKAN
jgi:hypothetical protein